MGAFGAHCNSNTCTIEEGCWIVWGHSMSASLDSVLPGGLMEAHGS